MGRRSWLRAWSQREIGHPSLSISLSLSSACLLQLSTGVCGEAPWLK